MIEKSAWKLLTAELCRWPPGTADVGLDILRRVECRLFDYEQLKAVAGVFVYTIPTYAANGVARYGISTTGQKDPDFDIAYFCHANCKKIVGGMPRIIQVDSMHSCDVAGLEYYCTSCNSKLN